MIDQPQPDHAREWQREQRLYISGFILAVLLTVAAFAAAASGIVSGGAALATIGGLALAQVIVHLRCFMHIDLRQSHRDDLQLILFTGLIVLMMVGGTIWILWNQYSRM